MVLLESCLFCSVFRYWTRECHSRDVHASWCKSSGPNPEVTCAKGKLYFAAPEGICPHGVHNEMCIRLKLWPSSSYLTWTWSFSWWAPIVHNMKLWPFFSSIVEPLLNPWKCHREHWLFATWSSDHLWVASSHRGTFCWIFENAGLSSPEANQWSYEHLTLAL